MKCMIVAYDTNRGIGADNDLLWQRELPADLARFRQMTTGHTIIMGRRTFESIGRALPGRQNIVVTHRAVDVEGVTSVDSLSKAYQLAAHDAYIIGGGTIYEQALDDVEKIYATEVQAAFAQATVFFPVLDDRWEETAREHHEADAQNKYAYDFVTFTRT